MREIPSPLREAGASEPGTASNRKTGWSETVSSPEPQRSESLALGNRCTASANLAHGFRNAPIPKSVDSGYVGRLLRGESFLSRDQRERQNPTVHRNATAAD